MKDSDHEFATRKNGRNSRRLPRFFGSLFKIALLSIALGLYWRWNGGDPGVGPIFVRERHLATANATYLVSTFGLLSSIALLAAALQALIGRVEKQFQN